MFFSEEIITLIPSLKYGHFQVHSFDNQTHTSHIYGQYILIFHCNEILKLSL